MNNQQIKLSFLSQIDQRLKELNHYKAPEIHLLEARITLLTLQKIIINDHNINNELVSALKNRWKRIKNSNCHYLHDLKNPTNQQCIAIAKHLASELNTPYLLLIMPSLRHVPTTEYVESSYEEELLLEEIILSDDSKRIIHIPSSLEFAQVDGKLKHTSLFDGKAKKLSANEQSRFLSRHQSVQQVFDAIDARKTFKLFGDTVGAAVKRLVDGLLDGGSEKMGREYEELAGEHANLAILEFTQYYNSLSKEKQDMLSNQYYIHETRSDNEGKVTFSECWNWLVNPKYLEDGKQTTAYCVELIAGEIEEILKNNVSLYEICSYQDEHETPLELFNQQVHQCFIELQSQLKTVEKHPCFSPEEPILKEKLFQTLASNEWLVLKPSELNYLIREHYKTQPKKTAIAKGCKQLIKKFAQQCDEHYLQEALQGLTHPIKTSFYTLTKAPNKHTNSSQRFFTKEPPSKENLKRNASTSKEEPPLKRRRH